MSTAESAKQTRIQKLSLSQNVTLCFFAKVTQSNEGSVANSTNQTISHIALQI
jgi:hypothetical protein